MKAKKPAPACEEVARQGVRPIHRRRLAEGHRRGERRGPRGGEDGGHGCARGGDAVQPEQGGRARRRARASRRRARTLSRPNQRPPAARSRRPRRPAKVGRGKPDELLGANPGNLPLDRVRVDSSGRALTTNQGVPIADNQNSLKAGLRGPALLEDFILREKITHFDHERIPERIVHARGSAAHGFFECYEPLDRRHPGLVPSRKRASARRCSCASRPSRASAARPTRARDVRGFAVKFYTDEGNWDLVGNNIPVFFIQDAMKFPDLVHAVKPEPHHAMPQAASAHDTFWDFVSLMPESTHMLHVGDVATARIPRSYSHDAGLRRPHVPPRERGGRVALREVPLEPGARHALARLGRGGEDLRRRSRLPPPRPVGGDRGGRTSRSGSSGSRSSPRSRPSGFSFDVLDPDQDRPRGAGARAPGRAAWC